MKNDPVRRRWVDVSGVYKNLTDTYDYFARPRKDHGAVPPPKGHPLRPQTSPIVDDKTMIEYVEGPVLYVFTGTWTLGTHTYPHVTLANCVPKNGGYYKDDYILQFHGPREEAIAMFMAHREFVLT